MYRNNRISWHLDIVTNRFFVSFSLPWGFVDLIHYQIVTVFPIPSFAWVLSHATFRSDIAHKRDLFALYSQIHIISEKREAGFISRNVIASVVGRQPTATNRSSVLMPDACHVIDHRRSPGPTTNAGKHNNIWAIVVIHSVEDEIILILIGIKRDLKIGATEGTLTSCINDESNGGAVFDDRCMRIAERWCLQFLLKFNRLSLPHGYPSSHPCCTSHLLIKWANIGLV